MAVTKRTRFEVLRRDGFRCRYCGATPDETELTVDHVVPVALGGGDKADNLVAACKDCNAGKASTSPDETSVAQVSEDAVRWRMAVFLAAADEVNRIEESNRYCDQFLAAWENWVFGYKEENAPLPPDWRATVARWRVQGMPIEILTDSIRISMHRQAPCDAKFQYLCGIVRNRLTELHEAAKVIYDRPAVTA